MAVNIAVEPFDTEFLGNYENGSYDSKDGTLTVSFFGTPIWEITIPEGVVDGYDLDAVTEIAKEELGKVISERLYQRIKPSKWGGIQID